MYNVLLLTESMKVMENFLCFTNSKYEGYGKFPTSYKNAVLV